MKANHIAKGGLYTALGLIFIYLSSIMPTNRLSLIGIASCIIPISIVTTNMRTSVLVYASTSLLSFFILSTKTMAVFYIIFFGLYGFIKFYVERFRRLPLELFLKLLFFNGSIAIMFLVYKAAFAEAIKINFSIYLAAAIAQIVFLVYDYALTLFVDYYNRHFIKNKKHA